MRWIPLYANKHK